MSVKDFFRPHRLGFHLLLAIGVSLIILCIVIVVLLSYTRNGSEFKMPNYIGQNSENLIENNPDGFIFIVRNTLYNKEVPDGSVLEQDPLPGEMIKKGRKVYLTCSSIVPPTVLMPQLAGDITLSQAKRILETTGLELGSVKYTESDNVNLVLEQYYKGRPIKKGTVINKGEKITLEVGARLSDIIEQNTPMMNDVSIDYDETEEDGEQFYYNE